MPHLEELPKIRFKRSYDLWTIGDSTTFYWLIPDNLP